MRAATGGAAPFSSTAVDFDAVKRFKYALLETAWQNFRAGARSDLRPDFEDFGQEQAHWLDDYALFRALKARYDGAGYLEWPEELVRRTPAALDQARRELASQIDRVRFAQFLLFRQGARLKAHARAKGVRLDRRPALLRLARIRATCGPTRSCSCSTRSTGRASSPGCRPTTSARRDSGGAIRSMTGTRWPRGATAGASIACAPCSRTSTPSASIISGDSRRRGTYRPGRRPRSPVSGCRARAPTSSARSRRPWAVCRSSPRTWGSSRRTWARSATRSTFRGRACCSSRSTATPTTRICPTTTPPTRSSTRALTTTRRRVDGTRTCPTPSAAICGGYLKRAPGTSADAAPALLDLAWSSDAALAIAPLQDVLNLGKEARMNQPGSAEGNWRWRCHRGDAVRLSLSVACET